MMASNSSHKGGINVPLTRQPLLTLKPEPETTLLTSKKLRSLGPRVQRFSKLSDAYSTITSRQISGEGARKVSDQSQSSTSASLQATLPSSNAGSPRRIKSQDAISFSSSPSAEPTCMKSPCRASVDSLNIFGECSPSMEKTHGNHLNLNQKIEKEPPNLDTESCDTTNSSTIEGILDQYDADTCGNKMNHVNTKVCRTNANSSISQPPQYPLPETPFASVQLINDICHNKDDSPALDSSVTDSQHLLDVDAQGHELQEVRKPLMPAPLTLLQQHQDPGLGQGHQVTAVDDRDPFADPEGEVNTDNEHTNPNADACNKFLRPGIEREISLRLRHLEGRPGNSTGSFYTDAGDFGDQTDNKLQKTGQRPTHHIRVVVGPETKGTWDNFDHNAMGIAAENKHRETMSEDGDWVTEATSDAGFGYYVDRSAPPRRPFAGEYNRAGSSLADYSDDGQESALERYGSHERIIQHPDGDDQYRTSGVRKSIDFKFGASARRRQSGLLDNVHRRWASISQKENVQFRHQVLRKNYQRFSSGRSELPDRLVFNFDQNAPPRYAFRDSASEYEPAGASMRANCGTNPYDTHGSLPSPVPGIKGMKYPYKADVDVTTSPNFDVPRNEACHPHQGIRPNIYAADRHKHCEALERREFAVASSYYDQPSASSPQSKFEFELLPLGQAQKKNKWQRYSGATNETENATARLKRQCKGSPVDPQSSPLELLPKAVIASRDLSVSFTPSWDKNGIGLEDSPTPFAMGHRSGNRPAEARRYRKTGQKVNLNNSPSLSGSGTARRLWYGRREPLHPNRLQPFFIVPDDYVSDRSNRIRRYFFYTLVILSVLPFVGVLALTGAFREALKWATNGEVDRLTPRQRKIIKWILLAECIIYTGVVCFVSIYFALHGTTKN